MHHQTAWKLAQRWVDNFNRKDLEAILEQYTEDIVFISPALLRVAGFELGQLRGQDQLRNFFALGLKSRPNLHFELIEVLVGVRSIAIFYRDEMGMTIIDHAELDEQHKIIRMTASYAQPKSSESREATHA
jgi:hypothetical protein